MLVDIHSSEKIDLETYTTDLRTPKNVEVSTQKNPQAETHARPSTSYITIYSGVVMSGP